MITTEEALRRLFRLIRPIDDIETVPLIEAVGRVLAKPVVSNRNQPPFAVSAMDGFAVRDGDAVKDACLEIIGESAAGRGCNQTVRAGQAVRIFTGAPVPSGADRIVLQEDARMEDGEVTITGAPGSTSHIRATGIDFCVGAEIPPRQILKADLISLIAAMNVATVDIVRRPEVAIIATGNELRMPGHSSGADDIIASSIFGLAALLKLAGAVPHILPIAQDNLSSLQNCLEMAHAADLIVTLGGASVGDHDLVIPAAREMGFELAFHKVAMRPGKPVFAASSRNGQPLVGLPGNPVSAMVCSRILLWPAIGALQHLGQHPVQKRKARLATAVTSNGPREHFMRAAWQHRRTSDPPLEIFGQQDSSLVSVMAQADALVVRPPFDPDRAAGDWVEYIDLRSPLDTYYEQL
ncbi:MAG: molybdopterin molybdotransferase MoeA [Rhodobacteraceae bacterium]|nr:molybdopterin molybdotransferase MoeA [Paracoccaceae bacterium]